MMMVVVYLWIIQLCMTFCTAQTCLNCLNTTSEWCHVISTSSCDCECQCNPGYYRINNAQNVSACATVRWFGGKMVFNEEVSKLEATTTIRTMFQPYPAFIEVLVFNAERQTMATIVSYQLIFKNQQNTYTDIEQEFSNLYNCSLLNSTIATTDVNLAATCPIVVDPTILCNGNTSFSSMCDKTSTSCNTSEEGFVMCSCNQGYQPNTPTSCMRAACITDSECNNPFGKCKVGTCSCFWGFYGSNCGQPWLFIFTVVTSVCGFLIIILVTTIICQSKKGGASSVTQNGVSSHEGDVDLKNPFTDFQPGQMRARVPYDRGLEMEGSNTTPTPRAQPDGDGTYVNIGFESNHNKHNDDTAAKYF
uniref:Uncharacterized LOC100178414 n=1 Tax=Ciona intestinalis TaxID=7719 RepID=F6QLR3_CIOIN|nr:uncharacterized protein LOC100178414 [Ciona intestinalis]|eukprot:XP_002123747.2 uncharacterized protein LOC100178414 [Ciona intestinalis]